MCWVDLSALRHLVDILARDQVNPPLAADEIVTTGTLTRALPLSRVRHGPPNYTGVALDQHLCSLRLSYRSMLFSLSRPLAPVAGYGARTLNALPRNPGATTYA